MKKRTHTLGSILSNQWTFEILNFSPYLVCYDNTQTYCHFESTAEIHFLWIERIASFLVSFSLDARSSETFFDSPKSPAKSFNSSWSNALWTELSSISKSPKLLSLSSSSSWSKSSRDLNENWNRDFSWTKHWTCSWW